MWTCAPVAHRMQRRSVPPHLDGTSPCSARPAPRSQHPSGAPRQITRRAPSPGYRPVTTPPQRTSTAQTAETARDCRTSPGAECRASGGGGHTVGFKFGELTSTKVKGLATLGQAARVLAALRAAPPKVVHGSSGLRLAVRRLPLLREVDGAVRSRHVVIQSVSLFFRPWESSVQARPDVGSSLRSTTERMRTSVVRSWRTCPPRSRTVSRSGLR